MHFEHLAILTSLGPRNQSLFAKGNKMKQVNSFIRAGDNASRKKRTNTKKKKILPKIYNIIVEGRW